MFRLNRSGPRGSRATVLAPLDVEALTTALELDLVDADDFAR